MIVKPLILLWFLFCVLVSCSIKEKAIQKISFGSCNQADEPQDIFNAIAEQNPDVWIWTGDAAYVDTKLLPLLWIPSTIDVVKQRFNEQLQSPEYQKLLNLSMPVLGVWDDHDFNSNDGGKEHEMKKEMQHAYLEFLNETISSPRWTREGLYNSYTFGPEGKQVKLILLDGRYHRDSPSIFGSGDILGEKQWIWLEKELTSNTAQITIFFSGVQILSHDKYFIEKWGNYPESRSRLFNLIRYTKTKGVLFVSGDVHYSEILKSDCIGTDFPIYEIISSGMTHSCANEASKICEYFLNYTQNSIYSLNQSNYQYGGLNFGTIKINWEKSPVQISLNIHDKFGKIQLNTNISLDDISKAKEDFYDQEKCEKIEKSITFLNIWPKLLFVKVTLGLIVFIGFPILFYFIYYIFYLKKNPFKKTKRNKKTNNIHKRKQNKKLQ